MPYHWNEETTHSELTLWPHRSLTKPGFKWFFLVTAALVSLPLVAVLGTAILWGLLPFFLLTIGLLWLMIERNDRDLNIRETLRISTKQFELVRQNPRSAQQHWDCNTYWVNLTMHDTTGPVPHYITLSGNGREVEIGAFLSEDERLCLFQDLQDRLNRYR